ncbi:MAG: hypothetical protein MMC23_008352 [Stictis urceolatum]|nr:hypothetical protein [Stictis urceolata]
MAPSSSSIAVTSIAPSDIPGAIECIQQAFADDPYANWVFDRKAFSRARNCVSLKIRCEWGIQNALFHVAKDEGAETEEERQRVLGVAMWMRPKKKGQVESWGKWWQGWVLWGKQVAMNLYYGRGGLNVKRYYIWKDAQAKAHSELWDDPQGYYFCNIVTVLPPAQGKGVGRKLFEEVTRKADEEGKRCYLESSRDVPNTAIYERLGFRKVKEMDCDDEGDACKVKLRS